MKIFLTIGLSLLMVSCATQRQHSNRDNPISKPIPHVGGPMQTILGDTDLKSVLEPFLEKRNGDEKSETLQLQREFLNASGLKDDELTGQTRLIFNDLGSILAEARQGVSKKLPEGTHKECVDAYFLKYQWHLDNNGEVPPTFGKITEYVLTPLPGTDYWVGTIDLCTWIGAENYYFNISFLEEGNNSLSLKLPPFSDVIASLTEEDTAGFNYKLHAKGNGSVIYKNVFKNSIFYPAGHPIYAELEQDCFDTFYVNKPTGIKAVDLADQTGYCMGRCDGKVLNTGK